MLDLDIGIQCKVLIHNKYMPLIMPLYLYYNLSIFSTKLNVSKIVGR
jgi:hypothetical protein